MKQKKIKQTKLDKSKFTKSKLDEIIMSKVKKSKKRENIAGKLNAKSNSKTKEINILKKIENYMLPDSKSAVKPIVWELPNRKRFFSWVQDTYAKYNLSKKQVLSKNEKNEITRYKELDKINLNNVQKLTRDFMQGTSPYRGLLLYLGLGVGKTCAAISIAEAIQNRKEVVILSKASLEDNFISEIQRCGTDYMTKNNYWVFSKCNTEAERELVKSLNIPTRLIEHNGGIFFVDFTKNKSNYDRFSDENKDKIQHQILETIKNRYKFLHLDDTRLLKKVSESYFDNKVVVIDEVHNLINTIASGRPRGEAFYEMFMNAKKAKFVFLSGTPLINNVYESTKLYNILRGYIPTIVFKLKSTFDDNINYKKIKSELQKNIHVDQIVINKINKSIKVTKNPTNFVSSTVEKGIIYQPDKNITMPVFISSCEKIINMLGYKVSISASNETCLPDDINKFQQLFHNVDLNKLKKTELFKKRIAGLTSYYQFYDKSKFPEVKPINIVQIPMSLYQLGIYERFRNEEIQKDKFKAKKKGPDAEKFKPSYRIKSRLACTFVFPEDTGNPYEEKNIEMLEDLEQKLEEIGEDNRFADVEGKDLDKKIKMSYLKILNKKKDQYLDMNNGSLEKYSPKYKNIITNIKKCEGTVFVYSYFRSLIGLNTFSFALEQTGEYTPFKIKKVNDMWELDIKEENMGKKTFCFYTGNENRELRELYRKIYNGAWDDLDSSCSKLVKQLYKLDNTKNLYGNTIKVLMTTKTGAEGLNLKCVRQVHIMEPYWQPVLIEQVIGRAVRNESHLKLPPRHRNVEVFIYMMTLTPDLIRNITIPNVRLDIVKFQDNSLGKTRTIATSDEYLYIISERKKKIVNEMQKLMKESAFDCTLNYHDNVESNPDLVCLDYETDDRDEYLYSASISDTIDIIDLKQEQLVTTKYKEVIIGGKKYYFNPKSNEQGKIYLYDSKIKKSVKLPKPVGRVFIKDGKYKFGIKSKSK